jgi:hypothetical protein
MLKMLEPFPEKLDFLIAHTGIDLLQCNQAFHLMAKQFTPIAARLVYQTGYSRIRNSLRKLQHACQYCLARLDHLDRSVTIDALRLLQHQLKLGTFCMILSSFVDDYTDAGVREVAFVASTCIVAEFHQKMAFG